MACLVCIQGLVDLLLSSFLFSSLCLNVGDELACHLDGLGVTKGAGTIVCRLVKADRRTLRKEAAASHTHRRVDIFPTFIYYLSLSFSLSHPSVQPLQTEVKLNRSATVAAFDSDELLLCWIHVT